MANVEEMGEEMNIFRVAGLMDEFDVAEGWGKTFRIRTCEWREN